MYPITLHFTENDTEFYRLLNEIDQCLLRDVLPHDEFGTLFTEEEITLSARNERHVMLYNRYTRKTDRAHAVFFYEGQTEIGYALYITFHSEDGKCFVLEFAIYPSYRCCGLGRRCFAALQEYTEAHGATYFELNTYCHRAARFWQACGFIPDGYDEYGGYRMLLPPAELSPVTCTLLQPADSWQLFGLLNTLYAEINLPFLIEKQKTAVHTALQTGAFFCLAAMHRTRVVGVWFTASSPSFLQKTFPHSTLLIEPAFRNHGIAAVLQQHRKSIKNFQ